MCILFTDSLIPLYDFVYKVSFPRHLRSPGFYLPVLSRERQMVHKANKMITRMKNDTLEFVIMYLAHILSPSMPLMDVVQ